MSDKHEALLALGKRRQDARWQSYAGIGDYHCGRYQCDEVSPYSKTAKNVDADLFVMLQDWASDEKLRQRFDQQVADLGYTPDLLTNKRLVRILNEVFGYQLADVYGTNLFPFIKQGPMSSAIPSEDLLRAAREYAVPQIDIVKPQVVVCLGLATFRALAVVLGRPAPKRLVDALDSPFPYGEIAIWCQPHPAGRGLGLAAQMAKWKEMHLALAWPS
jgi:hypothetical protein